MDQLIQAKDLKDFIEKANGEVILVSDESEDTLRITGEVQLSSLLDGCINVETPFGYLYIDEDEDIFVREI